MCIPLSRDDLFQVHVNICMINIHASISLYISLEPAIYFVGALNCGSVGKTVRLARGRNGVRIQLFRY